jgi:hypothetical protein
MDDLRKVSKANCLVSILVGLSITGSSATGTISPAFLHATLGPGDCTKEIKTVEVPEIPPKVDVVFAFDLTGSMWGIIGTAKAKAGEIIATLNAIPGVDIQYGVMSYMDYPGSYSSCGYWDLYGDAGSGDYAYRLGSHVTGDTTAVVNAINSLVQGWGADSPQDYTRVFFESYADPFVGWRAGAKRILVNFGDDVPHDCDLNEGVPGKSGTWSTGGDPGPDEIIGTDDDLDLQTVLADMAAAGIVLLESHTTTYANEYWQYWTGITGGSVFITTSANLVEQVVGAIQDAITGVQVCGLHLEAGEPFASWLTSNPISYDCFMPPGTKTFDLSICVPADTPSGPYLFTISAVDEVGVSYGEQIVSIDVIVELPVDIKPGSCPNPINLKDQGMLPVAILGKAGFDVDRIDPATIALGRPGVSEAVHVLRWAYEDVGTPFDGELCDCHAKGADGFRDLTLKFDAQEVIHTLRLGEVVGETLPLTIIGSLKNGVAFTGQDCVRVQGK